MTDQVATLVEVFDSDLDELLTMRIRGFASIAAETYATVQSAYLSGNDDVLLELIQGIPTTQGLANDEREILISVARARYVLRTHQTDDEIFGQLEKMISRFPEWEGEICFILANRGTAEKRYDRARSFSLRAWKSLKKVGAKRKAVRALMNYVAAESCLQPNKHYLSDLYYVYREAKKSKDTTSIGTTLLNLSREYQKLGAFSVALKYANRSLAVLSKNAGTIAYFFSLSHRCHLYCQLGAFSEAQLDADTALTSRFPEIHSAIEVLRTQHSELRRGGEMKPSTQKTASTTFTWNERRKKQATPSLTKLEQKILLLLSERPRSKDELVKALYGDRLDSTVSYNRLYNLLSRIKKRLPKFLIFADGKYRLAESAFLVRTTKKRVA